MAQQSIPVIEKSLQKTHEWFQDVMDTLGLETRHDAYIILRAILHAIRDKIPHESAVKFAAQFPLIIKGIYYDEWVLKNALIKIHQPEEFINLVEHYINNAKLSPISSNQIARVLGVIGSHITPEEILKISHLFPEKVRAAIFPDIIFQIQVEE